MYSMIINIKSTYLDHGQEDAFLISVTMTEKTAIFLRAVMPWFVFLFFETSVYIL